MQYAFVEFLIGKFRAECLNLNWLQGKAHARNEIAAWRSDYNTVGPHKLLGCRTPIECERTAPNSPEGLSGVSFPSSCGQSLPTPLTHPSTLMPSN